MHPKCDGNKQKLCKYDCKYCYDRSFAAHPRSEEWSDKNKDTPKDYFPGTKKKVWLYCDICFHDYETSVGSITAKNVQCNFCTDKNLCDNDCLGCHDKSFASHEKAHCWSLANEKSARQCFKHTADKYIFDCDICEHSFITSPKIIGQDKWCSYCGNKQLCSSETCKICFDKSFASSNKAKFWSDENKLQPREVFKASAVKYKFNCNKCHHSFMLPLHDVTSHNRWCYYCTEKKICSDENCDSCFDRSFASHPNSKYWLKRNGISPRNCALNSHEKYWFKCPKCKNRFCSSLDSINSGRWCPYCRHKTEAKFEFWIIEIFEIQRQPKFDWCKNSLTKRYFPFDFCIESLKIIIEIDGPQHFIQVSNWKSPERTQLRDRYKELCANKNGYTVIRLLQEDVYKDKNDWENVLLSSINRVRDSPTITTLYKGEEIDVTYETELCFIGK
jgi:very-short-patch-repair endonuclease